MTMSRRFPLQHQVEGRFEHVTLIDQSFGGALGRHLPFLPWLRATFPGLALWTRFSPVFSGPFCVWPTGLERNSAINISGFMSTREAIPQPILEGKTQD